MDRRSPAHGIQIVSPLLNFREGIQTNGGSLILLRKCGTLAVSPRSSMAELLICNQRVGGSNPSVGSREIKRADPTGEALHVINSPLALSNKDFVLFEIPEWFPEPDRSLVHRFPPEDGRFTIIFSECYLYGLCDIMRWNFYGRGRPLPSALAKVIRLLE